MQPLIKAPKGTQDILSPLTFQYRFFEKTMLEIAAGFGFKEIRTPVFEHTELFSRGVGDTTDVVQKEMYTFNDKGERSITLRPEGTAGVVRAFLEHGLFNEVLPQKLCYVYSCYRYEKPQAGRWREFEQFGAEILGTESPAADAELISLADEIFYFLGFENLSLELNSIGCKNCRGNYHKALKDYFESKKDELCPTCLDRIERNPMRILDCKSPVCSKIAKDAPVVLDYICEECTAHFEQVKKYLEAMNIDYTINPKIVRGLDYYTRTVFEFVSNEIGSQGTVCGGGRYDGLTKELGGPEISALGFAMGVSRLLMLAQAQGLELPAEEEINLYIASIGENAGLIASRLAFELRTGGMSALFDIVGRSLKAQMKYADKIGASYTIVLGDDEIEKNTVQLKNMKTGEQTEMALDSFADEFTKITLQEALGNLQQALGTDDDLADIDLSLLLGN